MLTLVSILMTISFAPVVAALFVSNAPPVQVARAGPQYAASSLKALLHGLHMSCETSLLRSICPSAVRSIKGLTVWDLQEVSRNVEGQVDWAGLFQRHEDLGHVKRYDQYLVVAS